MTKKIAIGKYKLNYNVHYTMSYWDPLKKKVMNVSQVMNVKNQPAKVAKAGDMIPFLKKKAKQELDAKMSGYKAIHKYKLTKIAKAKVVKVLYQQVWDVNVTYRFHNDWLDKKTGEIIHGASQLNTMDLAIHAVKVTAAMVLRRLLHELNLMATDYVWPVLEKLEHYEVIGQRTLKKNANFKIENEFMMEATPITYSWIPDIKFSNNSMCVYNALGSLKRCPKYFKTPSKLLAKFQEYEDSDSQLAGRETITLTLTGGIPPRYIQELCREHDITHYCLDILEKTHLKHISKSSNYDPICYVTHDNHMYLIIDKKFMNRLSKNRSTNPNIIVGMLRAQLDDKEDELDIKNIIEKWSIDTLPTLKDCFVIEESMSSLHDILIELFRREKVIYAHTSKNNAINSIKYKNNVRILVDPNHSLNLRDKDGNAVTWKTIQKICKLKNLPFKNQSFPALAMKIVKDVLQPPREECTKNQKKMINDRQGNKCNLCDGVLKKAQYDHIIPLVAGGTNELDNFQALCLECHFEKSKNEVDNGDYFYLAPYTSTFNATTREIVMSDLFKRYAFIERLGNVPGKKKAYYIDVNKCRRNILLHMKENGYDLPVFTCMDEPEKFTVQYIAPGFYFVECNQYFPLRGNGWYSHAMVQYCLDQKVIKRTDIKYQILSGLTLEGDYFNKSLEALIALPDGLDKLGPNVLAGLFNKDHATTDRLFFTNNFRYASTKYMEAQNNDVFIQEVDKDSHLYEVKTSTRYELDLINTTMYHLILDLEAVELHKMKNLIEKAGGHVTFLSTDCCECWFDDNTPMKIDNVFWDNDKKLPKYKYEYRTVPPSIECMKKFKREHTFSFVKPNWNIISDPIDAPFDKFAEEIVKLGSFNGDGRAGTGKTTLERAIVKVLDRQGKKYVLLAPTNKAARQISKEAITIHKFLAKSFSDRKALGRQIEKLDYIIIDEVSMVKEIFFKVFATIKMIKPSINFIIAGDERQIPPPCDRVKFEYKDSLVFQELCCNNRVELTKCRRSDDALFNLSLDVDKIDITQLGHKIYPISISYTNKKRIEINGEYMKRYSQVSKWVLDITKLPWDKNSQDMKIYEGLPLIARVNASRYEIANNETFKVVGKTDTNDIKISDGVSTKIIPLKEIARYFHPAYCMTCHRVQGTTIDQPFTIFEWGRMDTKLRYTALTRGTKKEYVNILM